MSVPAPLEVGLRFAPIEYPAFDWDLVNEYAQAALDDNVIHLDADIASAAGFEAPIVHGMLVYARFEQAARLWCPGMQVKQLVTQFAKPLLQGEAFSLKGHIVAIRGDGNDRQIVIRAVSVKEDGKPFCISDVTVCPGGDSL